MKVTLIPSRLRPLLALVVVAAVLSWTTGLERASAAPANEWYKVFDKPFSATAGNNRVLAMIDFKGALYAGVGSSDTTRTSANVLRMVNGGCREWNDVTPPWSPKTSGQSMAMLVFSNHLYVGTDQGQVFRTANGTAWSNVTGNLKAMGIEDMAAFGGQLYVASGRIAKYAEIWRTSNSTATPHAWEPVVGPSPALHPPAFGVSPTKYPIAGIESLEVLGNHLYAGLGLDDSNGIQLWRTGNGKNWAKFKEVHCTPPCGMMPGHVHALEAFKGSLYVGEYHGRGLFRTDGSATSWSYIPNVIPSGDIYRLEEHGGKLYLGVSAMSGSGTGPLVYSSADGTSWTAVPGSPVQNSSTNMITALASYDGRLYVGANHPGKSGNLAIHRYGAPGPYCVVELADPCPFLAAFWWLCEPLIDPGLIEVIEPMETTDGWHDEIVERGSEAPPELDIEEAIRLAEEEERRAACEEQRNVIYEDPDLAEASWAGYDHPSPDGC